MGNKFLHNYSWRHLASQDRTWLLLSHRRAWWQWADLPLQTQTNPLNFTAGRTVSWQRQSCAGWPRIRIANTHTEQVHRTGSVAESHPRQLLADIRNNTHTHDKQRPFVTPNEQKHFIRFTRKLATSITFLHHSNQLVLFRNIETTFRHLIIDT